jgi:hypothetical protein
VRDTLFDSAVDFLPEANIRKLVDELWKRTKVDSSHAYHWITPIESLARQLKDPVLFETARRAAKGELSSQSMLDVAQVWLDSGNAKMALSWLEQIPQPLCFGVFGYDRLLLDVYRKLNDKGAEASVAWRVFRQHRSQESFETLLSAIGKNQRRTVIDKETKSILQSMSLSYSDAQFLVDCGSIDDAEAYITRSAGQFDGNRYGCILPLAEVMEKHRRYFAATVLYRALLDSILKRAQSRAYHHGADYLQKLDKFAPKVPDWDCLIPHDQYLQQLRRSHSRKIGFWTQYEQ